MKSKVQFGIILPGLALSIILLSGCVKSNVGGGGINTSYTLTDLIQSADNLKVLDSALKKTHLDTLFSKYGPFTYFVATDGVYALAGISDSTVNALSDTTLKKLLLYSAIPQSMTTQQFPAGPDAGVLSEEGDSLFITSNNSGYYINGILLVSYDAIATNGVIDAVQYPLLPPAGNILQVAQSDSIFSYFVAAVNRIPYLTGLLTTAGDGVFTIFLPDNNAFRGAGYATISDINGADINTLSTMLEYHILPKRLFTSDFSYGSLQATLLTGNNVTVGNVGQSGFSVHGNNNGIASVIISSNIMATNGVIHVIDQMLLH